MSDLRKVLIGFVLAVMLCAVIANAGSHRRRRLHHSSRPSPSVSPKPKPSRLPGLANRCVSTQKLTSYTGVQLNDRDLTALVARNANDPSFSKYGVISTGDDSYVNAACCGPRSKVDTQGRDYFDPNIWSKRLHPSDSKYLWDSTQCHGDDEIWVNYGPGHCGAGTSTSDPNYKANLWICQKKERPLKPKDSQVHCQEVTRDLLGADVAALNTNFSHSGLALNFAPKSYRMSDPACFSDAGGPVLCDQVYFCTHPFDAVRGTGSVSDYEHVVCEQANGQCPSSAPGSKFTPNDCYKSSITSVASVSSAVAPGGPGGPGGAPSAR